MGGGAADSSEMPECVRGRVPDLGSVNPLQSYPELCIQVQLQATSSSSAHCSSDDASFTTAHPPGLRSPWYFGAFLPFDRCHPTQGVNVELKCCGSKLIEVY